MTEFRKLSSIPYGTVLPALLAMVKGVNRSRNRVCALGDSQTARNHRVVIGSTYNTSTNGYLVVLNGLLHNRMSWTDADNYGVVGDRMIQAEARVPKILASDAGTCFFHIFTNDCLYIARYASSTPSVLAAAFAESVASFYRSLESLLTVGIQVFLIPPQQRTTAAWTTNFGLTTDQVSIARRLTAAFRDVMISAASRYRDAILLDPTAAFVDVGGGPKTNYTDDGTHYRDYGTFAMAKVMAPIVATRIARTAAPFVDLSDTYEINQNPRGNLLLNSLMIGAAVAVNAAPLSGNTVNSWGPQVSNQGTITAGTAVLAPVARPDGLGQGIRLTVSGLAGNSANVLLGVGQSITIDESRVKAADLLENAGATEVLSASVGFRGAQVRPVETDGSGTSSEACGPELTGSGFSTEAASYVWSTLPLPIRPSGGAGSRSVVFRMLASLDTTVSGGVSADVIFWAPSSRKKL